MNIPKSYGYFTALLVLVFASIGLAEPVRIAVTPFHWEDSSYLSAETGAEYAMVFYTGALEMEGVKMVERDGQSPLWDELTLIGAGATRLEWQNVDIVVRGRFEMKRSSGIHFFYPFRLKLDIIDVSSADILETWTLDKSEIGKDDQARELLLKQAPVLLRKAMERRERLKNTARFYAMFFPNQSENDRLDNFELNFKSELTESLQKRKTPLEPLSFGGSEDALEEQTLNWLGFTNVDRSEAWKDVADYFVWGEYREVLSNKPLAHDDILIDATIFWLAKDGTTGKASNRFRVGDFNKGVQELADNIPGTPVLANNPEKTEVSLRLSDQLIERALPLLHEEIAKILNHDPKLDKYLTSYVHRYENEYAQQLVFTSCLFDPGNLKKQYTLLQFGEESLNPALNAKKIRRIEDWLAAAVTAEEGDRLPRAALANMILPRFKISRRNWSVPRNRVRPLAVYQTPESIENFILLMRALTDVLGKDNVQKPKSTPMTVSEGGRKSKKLGYADSFVSSILSDVVSSNWMKAEHKAEIIKLAWSLVPDSQRKDLLLWVEKDIGKLKEEVGTESLQRILETPSRITHPNPVPGESTHVAPDSSISENRDFRSFPIPATSKSKPAKIRHSYPYHSNVSRKIYEQYREEDIIVRSVRKLSPQRAVIEGQIKVETGFPQELNLSFNYTKQGLYFSRKPPDKIFRRQLLWASDGKWGITKVFNAESNDRSVDQRYLDLFQVVKITPEGKIISDISPDDSNMIRNTRNIRHIVDDRFIVLTGGFGNDVVDMNFYDLSAGRWQSVTVVHSGNAENLRYGDRLHSRGTTSVVCNRRVAVFLKNGAAVYDFDAKTTVPLGGVYSSIIERNHKRFGSHLSEKGMPDEEIARAVDAWEFSIDAVSATGKRIFLLHSGGISSFDPAGVQTGEYDLTHLDVRDLKLLAYEDGECSWLSGEYHRFSGELGDIWLWLAESYSPYEGQVSKLYLIDRKNLSLLGIVALPEVVRGEQMVTLGDSVYLVYKGNDPNAAKGSRKTKKFLMRLTREQLLEVVRKAGTG